MGSRLMLFIVQVCFDYLSQRVCKKLVNVFNRLLRPGGLLVVTNVSMANPDKAWMEYILEWNLIYRDRNGMQDLIPGSTVPLQTEVKEDATGVNYFLEIRKSADEWRAHLKTRRGKTHSSAAPAPDSPTAAQLFDAQEAPLRVANYQRAAVMAIIFVLAGAGMDILSYPERLHHFLTLRVVCSLLLGLIYLALHLKPAGPLVRLYGLLIALLPLIMIQWMLVKVPEGGPRPTTPVSTSSSWAPCFSCASTRPTPSSSLPSASSGMSPHPSSWEPRPPTSAPTGSSSWPRGTFACVGIYYYNQLRFREFKLLQEITSTNDELADALRELRENEARPPPRREALLARPHERRHRARDQQPPQLRQDRPACPPAL